MDVAWSGDRQPGSDGKVPAVGSTVDLKTAKFSNTIGAATLTGSSTDEQFDPAQHTFYYARALVIPTPRAGAPEMPCGTICRYWTMFRPPSISAPGPHRSCIRLKL
jgi:hypothetical protein